MLHNSPLAGSREACNVSGALQSVACVVECFSVLQCIAICCGVSQCVAVCCSVLQSLLSAGSRKCSMSTCSRGVAVWFSVFQRDAVCFSVMPSFSNALFPHVTNSYCTNSYVWEFLWQPRARPRVGLRRRIWIIRYTFSYVGP